VTGRTKRGFTARSVRTTVAEAHGAPFPDDLRRAVWFIEPTDAAVVLGSAQRLSTLELGEVARRGLGVVRRRSGGGAVVVEPEASSWFDVWLPAADALFEHDVSRSAHWLGEVVVEALDLLGVAAQRVRAGDVDRSSEGSRWAPLVCFASSSAGEVLVEGRKAVGVSQRRTRAGARFQVVILHRFDPGATASLCALDPTEQQRLAAHLSRSVTAVPVERAAVRDAVDRVLATR
jgi:lipoate-protein ligase A